MKTIQGVRIVHKRKEWKSFGQFIDELQIMYEDFLVENILDARDIFSHIDTMTKMYSEDLFYKFPDAPKESINVSLDLERGSIRLNVDTNLIRYFENNHPEFLI